MRELSALIINDYGKYMLKTLLHDDNGFRALWMLVIISKSIKNCKDWSDQLMHNERTNVEY